jgi:flagellar assembly protein FliH
MGIRKPNGPTPGGPAPVVPWRMETLGTQPEAQRDAPPPPPARPPEEELARIREEARAEGHAAGLAAGLESGALEIAALGRLLGRLREVMEEHEQALASDVMGVAVELARQIMRHALQVHPEVVLPVIREAIASLPQGSEHPRLFLHPQDTALVRSVLDANQLTPAPWRIVEDARLERGGCRIETAASELDATLGSRWKAVLASLGRAERWVELEAPPRGPGAAAGPAEGVGGPAREPATQPLRPREAG